MAQFSYKERTIIFKIVYYGPALGGKTTSLETLHKITDPEDKTHIVSLKTDEDRTLFFDFLPFELGKIEGYSIKLQAYTVPGQVHYDTTRRVVLAGADGIIFVADSQKSKMDENKISWENMKANLLANNMNFAEIPIVIDCNKQDHADALSADEIQAPLNEKKSLFFPTCAIKGANIVTSFIRLLQIVLSQFVQKYKLTKKGVKAADMIDEIESVFKPYMDILITPEIEKEKPQKVESHKALSEEEQLITAIKSTTNLAVSFQESELLTIKYQDRLAEMSGLYEMSFVLPQAEAAADVAKMALDFLVKIKPYTGATLFWRDESGIQPVYSSPFSRDPLWYVKSGGSGNMAASFIQADEVKIYPRIHRKLIEAGILTEPEIYSVATVPVKTSDIVAYILVYSLKKEHRFGEEEERFLRLFERQVSGAIQNTILTESLHTYSTSLEEMVKDRTQQLIDAMEKLKELDRMKEEFLNNVSHEMMTPLTNIRSYTELLRMYPDETPEAKIEFLDIIENESVHLEELISNLLDFSRMKRPIRNELCDVSMALYDILGSFQKRMTQKGLKVDQNIEQKGLNYKCNPEDIKCLFRQIIDNSTKFSADGGTIKVYLLDDPDKLIFAVRDFGPGFPQDQKERLMKSFEQVPSGMIDKPPGLGMGLSLVSEIISKYKGKIHIENMNPGTNMVIELPKEKNQ